MAAEDVKLVGKLRRSSLESYSLEDDADESELRGDGLRFLPFTLLLLLLPVENTPELGVEDLPLGDGEFRERTSFALDAGLTLVPPVTLAGDKTVRELIPVPTVGNASARHWY